MTWLSGWFGGGGENDQAPSPSGGAGPWSAPASRPEPTPFDTLLTQGADGSQSHLALADMLVDVLEDRGVAAVRDGPKVRLPAYGLACTPMGLEMAMVEGCVRVSGFVRPEHSAFDMPPPGLLQGVADDPVDAYAFALGSWADIDLPVLVDMPRETPEFSTLMNAAGGGAGSGRRILLGPPQHIADRDEPRPPAPEEPHSFSPCCLFNACGDAARDWVASRETLGIHLFAARDQAGGPSAGCSVNGVDHPAAAAALERYAATWPDRGFEWRKQYAVIMPPLR